MTVQKDLDRRLNKIQNMVEENRVLLKKINRRLAWGQAMKMFYWVVIIGVSVAGYYAVQPYFEQVTEAYQGLQGGIGSVGDLFDKADR